MIIHLKTSDNCWCPVLYSAQMILLASKYSRKICFHIRGCFSHKLRKQIYHSIYRIKCFETCFVCEKHPLHPFEVLYPLKLVFVTFFHFPIFGVSRHTWQTWTIRPFLVHLDHELATWIIFLLINQSIIIKVKMVKSNLKTHLWVFHHLKSQLDYSIEDDNGVLKGCKL